MKTLVVVAKTLLTGLAVMLYLVASLLLGVPGIVWGVLSGRDFNAEANAMSDAASAGRSAS